MRWTTFAVLLYVATAFQVAHFGSLGGSASYPRIEFLPLLAVFYALYAPEEAAPLAGLCCGIIYDLFTPATIGMHAIPLALVAWGIVRIRMSIFREHIISQVVIPLLAIIAFGALTGVFRFAVGKFGYLAGAGLPASQLLKAFTINGFYSALVAPALFYLLFRMQSLTGFNQKGVRNRQN